MGKSAFQIGDRETELFFLHFPSKNRSVFPIQFPPAFKGYRKPIKFPVHPVMSCISDPSYKRATFLNYFLKGGMVDYQSKFSVKNSVDRIYKVRSVEPPPHSARISFDVEGLFPYISSSYP